MNNSSSSSKIPNAVAPWGLGGGWRPVWTGLAHAAAASGCLLEIGGWWFLCGKFVPTVFCKLSMHHRIIRFRRHGLEFSFPTSELWKQRIDQRLEVVHVCRTWQGPHIRAVYLWAHACVHVYTHVCMSIHTHTWVVLECGGWIYPLCGSSLPLAKACHQHPLLKLLFPS